MIGMEGEAAFEFKIECPPPHLVKEFFFPSLDVLMTEAKIDWNVTYLIFINLKYIL